MISHKGGYRSQFSFYFDHYSTRVYQRNGFKFDSFNLHAYLVLRYTLYCKVLLLQSTYTMPIAR